MNENTTEVPEWYDPAEAPTVDPGGYWVPPLVAGLGKRGNTISLVVLHHKSFEPAYIRHFPRDNRLGEQIHGALAEAAKALGDFNLLLCCAIEPGWLEMPQTDTPFRSLGPWLWVRYPHFSTSGAFNKNKYLDEAREKDHYAALALATQFQEDCNTLQEFDREFRHLQALTGAMVHLKQILLTRLPDDMRHIARLHHDLSF